MSIIIEPDLTAICGEEPETIAAALDAGVIYLCPINDGTCSLGEHLGPGFYHYAPGKTEADYDAVEP